MPLSTRRVLMGGSYIDQVLGTGPIAYWPLDEGAGTVARCLVNTAQNGTVTGVTWANDATGPFGSPAPYFDGITDQVSFPAAYYSNMDSAEGTAMIWARVDSGVWTDGTFRVLYAVIETNTGADRIIALRHSDDNVLYQSREATAGNSNTYPVTTGGPAGWFHWADVWSVSGNFIRSYYQGALGNSSTAAILAGVPTAAYIGVATGFPRWKGWMTHYAVWNRVLGASEILALANP